MANRTPGRERQGSGGRDDFAGSVPSIFSIELKTAESAEERKGGATLGVLRAPGG